MFVHQSSTTLASKGKGEQGFTGAVVKATLGKNHRRHTQTHTQKFETVHHRLHSLFDNNMREANELSVVSISLSDNGDEDTVVVSNVQEAVSYSIVL